MGRIPCSVSDIPSMSAISRPRSSQYYSLAAGPVPSHPHGSPSSMSGPFTHEVTIFQAKIRRPRVMRYTFIVGALVEIDRRGRAIRSHPCDGDPDPREQDRREGPVYESGVLVVDRRKAANGTDRSLSRLGLVLFCTGPTVAIEHDCHSSTYSIHREATATKSGL